MLLSYQSKTNGKNVPKEINLAWDKQCTLAPGVSSASEVVMAIGTPFRL